MAARITENRDIKVHIRHMIRRDMPAVLDIEESSYEFPWSEEEFIRCLRQRNIIGMVAECNDSVVAFVIYEFHKNRLHVLDLAVDSRFRRQGIGRNILERLKSKISHERRNRIALEIRERNVVGQLFFQSCGYRAVSVLREFWDDTDEDAYVMEYRKQSVEIV